MTEPLRNCHDCDAKPGEFHSSGCDIERCPLCGGQAIGCDCIYPFNGIDCATMEIKYPEIYSNGPTESMYARIDSEIEKYGGRLPWSGIWPDTEYCIEFGIYSRWVDRETGEPIDFNSDRLGTWQECKADDVGAGPDLNMLGRIAKWSKEQRRWIDIRKNRNG